MAPNRRGRFVARTIAALMMTAFGSSCAGRVVALHARAPASHDAPTASVYPAPKTELRFRTLPLPYAKLRTFGDLGGYALTFKNETSRLSDTCQLTCIGGDCGIRVEPERQKVLQDPTFLVTGTRKVGKRSISFLNSQSFTFYAPILFLDCPAGIRDASQLLGFLPEGTLVDEEKYRNLSLDESALGKRRLLDLYRTRCPSDESASLRSVRIFARTAKGIEAYDRFGTPVPIDAENPHARRCRTRMGTPLR